MDKRLDLVIAALIAALVAAVFMLDLLYPLGTAVWLLYVVPLALAPVVRWPLLPPVVAAMVCLLLIAGFFLSEAGVSFGLAVANRIMAGAIFAALGVLGYWLVVNRTRLARADWVNMGQIAVARAIQGEMPPARLAQQVLESMAERIGARAAVAYARNGRGFVRLASWGTEDALIPDRIDEGQGHLSRAVASGQPLRIDMAPDEALGWSSGLARGRTASTVLVPLRDGQLINGVLEFGLDRPAPDRVIDLFERVSDKLGIALRGAQYRDQLHELLEETRRQAEELRSHTEELAATNEELEEQTRALQDSQRRLEEQQAELENQNTRLETQTQELEEQRDALARSRRMLEDQAEALARESRYKSEFVANMSHELRTPLNALLIMSRLLAENRGGTLTEEQVRWAETIQSSGQDLLALINDILDLSKIEAGKVEIALDEIDAGHVAHRIIRAFEAEARHKGLELTADVAADLPPLRTDGQRLEQVLRNFVSNALKFTERGRITLRIARAPQGVAFAVEDTGIGIPSDQQEVVFEAFRQADGTISRKYGGTGLGLSISRELADLLGGRLTLDSQPGRGSTFTLILPERAPRGEARPAAPALPQPASAASLPVAQSPALGLVEGVEDDRDLIREGERVMLVVEDDPAFARILCDLSRELGFRCVCVSRADEAVTAARHYLPQAIVLDMGLPDHSGLSVLDRLKRDVSTRHIPVHVVSAEDHSRQALSQGAISSMMKPVRRDELSRAIRNLESRLEQRMRRVLIVEDDPAQMEGLKALLASDEVEAIGAGTAAEALRICRGETVDCIVLDLTLPDASGLDLLERLDGDGLGAFPPVIVYTARALTEPEEQRLRRYSKSIIIKGAKSPERLINEVTLFLHQVVSDLPEKQREMLAASLNRDAQLEGRRILVVEDDIRNVYALTGVFEPHGAHVQIARNGREALEALGRVNDGAAPRIDLVLMDVMMPEMDGLTATREIRKIDRWKTLPIIMLTAKAMAEDQNQCLAAGANDYLPKPLDVDKLLSLTRVWMPR